MSKTEVEQAKCPCCKAPCTVETEHGHMVFLEDENGERYSEWRHPMKTYRYAHPEPQRLGGEEACLVERLRVWADASDMGRKPDPTDLRREAADTIERLSTLLTAEAVRAEVEREVVGRKVEKRSGDYSFDGEIVAVIRKRSGEIRYAVEDDRGLLLIMNAKQCGVES